MMRRPPDPPSKRSPHRGGLRALVNAYMDAYFERPMCPRWLRGVNLADSQAVNRAIQGQLLGVSGLERLGWDCYWHLQLFRSRRSERKG